MTMWLFKQRFPGLLIFIIINITLLLIIREDVRLKNSTFFLKKSSPYYDSLGSVFRGNDILNALEVDLTSDNKPEFTFILQKSSCQICQKNLLIFQGEEKMFETKVSSSEIKVIENTLIINNGKLKTFEWSNNKFKEKLN